MIPAVIANHSTLFITVSIILFGVFFYPHSPTLIHPDRGEGRFEHVGKVADEKMEVLAESAKEAYHDADKYTKYLREKSKDASKTAAEYAKYAKHKGICQVALFTSVIGK